MAYSVDLRERVVRAVLERGMSVAEAARSFEVGTATVERYLRRYRERDDLRPDTPPGRPSGLAEHEQQLKRQLRQNDLRLGDHCRQWQQATGKQVSTATMSRWLRKIGVTRKKDA